MKQTFSHDMPLIEALSKLSPNTSKTTLKSWIKEGRVMVDNRPIKRIEGILLAGQSLELGAKPRFAGAGIRILYEDRHFVVIDKPAGILSVSTAFEKGETVHAFLKNKYRPKKVFVIHRLDQETSGVMIFSLTQEGFEKMKLLFKNHDIDRIYYAIVEGDLSSDSGTWESRLYEDSNYYVHPTAHPLKGENAITHYQVAGRAKKYSLLELKLETGRKNQIRVHCQHAGHPVAGDKKYGAQTDPCNRLCLHAKTLGFIHPMTGKKMNFTSDIPEIFHKIVKF